MKKLKLLGVREFRNRASQHLASGEVLGIQNHGRLIGVYVPLRAPDPQKVEQAALHLTSSVERVLQQTGLSEADLSALFELPLDSSPATQDAPEANADRR
jgi:antitoxin (DNA-binding transcriptional repressor) of toxin-antitoxin stability system